jgi:surface antigen
MTPASPAPSAAPAREQTRQAAHTPAGTGRPQIVQARQRLQCVPYARQLSNVQLRGDAWTWWGQAQGRYPRGQRPAVGSVLVLKRRGASRGHLAVVTQIVSDREVIANHANWLNKGRVHLNTPIRDVSPNNDWSAVKVWYTPGRVMGRSTYPAYGFVYPGTTTASR